MCKNRTTHSAQLFVICCTNDFQDDFIKIILDDDILRSQFTDLDYDLLKLSYEVLFSWRIFIFHKLFQKYFHENCPLHVSALLQRRAKLLSKQDQLCLYCKHMKSAVINLQVCDLSVLSCLSLMFTKIISSFFSLKLLHSWCYLITEWR